VEIVDWDKVDGVLHEGTPEEIQNILCSECGGVIRYEYARFDNDTGALYVTCETCGLMSRGHLGPNHITPNCVEYFGAEARIDKDLKLLATA
jgi:hypothetical protein